MIAVVSDIKGTVYKLWLFTLKQILQHFVLFCNLIVVTFFF